MTHGVPLRELLPSQSVLLDYWEANERLRELLPRHFLDRDAFASLARILHRRPYARQAIAEAIERQNRAFGADEPALAAARRLADPRALVAIGGQQAGLFGGPLYTLHKALTIRALAGRLEGELGCPVVPLFWIASEDHDLAEVARAWITESDGGLHEIALAEHLASAAASKVPVAEVRLGEGVSEAVSEAARAIDGSPAAEEVQAVLREAWMPRRSFSDAFGMWMQRLLRGLGVALVDPSDAGLKALSAPLLRREVAEQGLLARSVLEQTSRLQAAGYRSQIDLRDGMLSLFYHGPGRTGIAVTGQGFEASDGTRRWTAAELLELLEGEPTRFSPNAALRPLAQDALFPTVAFVLGPAETAYLAQLPIAYERFGIPMPVLFPRTSLTIIEPSIARLLSKHGLTLGQVIAARDRLAGELARRSLPAGFVEKIGSTRATLETAWDAIATDVNQLDPTLKPTAGLAAWRSLKQLDFLERKAARALKRRDAELRAQAARLAANLAPRGGLQERTLCAVSFLARYGFTLAKRVLEGMDISRPEHQGVELP